MKSHLYFICPTDQLESVIDNNFKQENYYITSLGNSIAFDLDMMCVVNDLILLNNIQAISFVLAQDNPVLLNQTKRPDNPEINGLDDLYQQISYQRQCAEVVWQNGDNHFLTLSYYLNEKIKELKMELNIAFQDSLSINGKIYDRGKKSFNDVYSNLICDRSISLN